MSTQFTPTLPPFHQITPFSNPIISNKHQIIARTTSSWSGFPTSKALSGFSDVHNCTEQMLVHCANAIDTNDVSLAQQILWVLNTIAPPDGDPNQRLASSFLRALTSRAAISGSSKMLAAVARAHHPNNLSSNHTHSFSVIELASFVDVTPWHRFGFTAANYAILEATEGSSVVHIVDLSSTHCMQIPTLIDAISTRHDVPPLIKLTVVESSKRDIPPKLDLPYDELGSKLVNFAKSKNVTMEFRVISSGHEDGYADLIQYLRVQRDVNEALVINCHMTLHRIPDETLYGNSISTSWWVRSMFLKAVRSLDPTLVVLVEEDADLTSSDLVWRVRCAFNYLWIAYDTMNTFLGEGSEKIRQWYEAGISWRIENVIAQEGVERVERLERRSRWVQRMRNAEFQGISASDDAVSEVKAMLAEHAAGWGLKKEDQHLVLTWKGHNVVFASAWMPASAS